MKFHMIEHGARPNRISHKDYDFLKSHKFGATIPTFEDEYFADAGLTMLDQNHADFKFVPPIFPQPFGCTNFAQAELATDLTKVIHRPDILEALTHANANGGYNIRDSLDAARKLGWFTQYFNLRSNGFIDWFDTFRLGQLMGANVGEHRSITWGTPWFASWEEAAQNGQAIMPMPTLEELKYPTAHPWHNSKLDGWTKRNTFVYRDKSWQGTSVGENGFIYFPRDVINTTMNIAGTVAFTATNHAVDNPQRIDISIVQFVVSVVSNLLSRYV